MVIQNKNYKIIHNHNLIWSRYLKQNMIFLMAFSFILLSCKRSEPGSVNELIEEWMSTREKLDDNTFQETAETIIKTARANSNPSGYVSAAIIFNTFGDLKTAKSVLDEAALKFPNIDGPHFEMADIYFQLALFDAFLRKRVKITRVPTNSITQEELQSKEFDLITDSSIPEVFIETLEEAGFSEKDQMGFLYIKALSTDPKTLAPPAREGRDLLLKKTKPPTHLPRLTWSPDQQNEVILRLAESELVKANNSNKMTEPKDAIVINRPKYNLLQQRVKNLLDLNN